MSIFCLYYLVLLLFLFFHIKYIYLILCESLSKKLESKSCSIQNYSLLGLLAKRNMGEASIIQNLRSINLIGLIILKYGTVSH